jgi:hypothetical protein
MMDDIRNAYGFPILYRVERAKQYAAEARERNKQGCPCDACRLNEMLPAVKQIAESWGKKSDL